MAESDATDDGVKTLYRMIAYIRCEAMRLHIPDMALLLEHAEEAVMACAPSLAVESWGGCLVHDGTARRH